MKGEPRYMDWSNQTWFASGDTAIIRRAVEIDAHEDPFHKLPIDLNGFLKQSEQAASGKHTSSDRAAFLSES